MERKQAEKIIDLVVKELILQRKNQKLSHEKVAELSGLHRSTISLIESRKREATLLTLLKIADTLNCDLGGIVSKSSKSIQSN